MTPVGRGRWDNNAGLAIIRKFPVSLYSASHGEWLATSINVSEMTMMKAFCAATAMTIAGSSVAAGTTDKVPETHRYLIERTFPAGAIDGVDAAAKRKVNANNATLDVTWEKSYANADKTKTYCVYTGPSEAAVRDAAKLSGLPVDSVVEIPSDLKAEPRGAAQVIAAGNRRYLVKRASAAQVNGTQDVRRETVDVVRHRRQARFVLGLRGA
jgi:hypothetical protein